MLFGLNDIQIGIIIGLTIIISIGFYASRYVKGKALTYLLAGRKLPFIIAAMALMGQGIDANVTLGNMGNVFTLGFWNGFALPLGLGITLLLTGLFFAERLNGMKLITLPDFFKKTYDRRIEVIFINCD